MKPVLITLGFLFALGAAIAFLVRQWPATGGGANISFIGWLTIIGGAIVTLALGGGLMALVFYSARRGYDDIDRRDGPG